MSSTDRSSKPGAAEAGVGEGVDLALVLGDDGVGSGDLLLLGGGVVGGGGDRGCGGGGGVPGGGDGWPRRSAPARCRSRRGGRRRSRPAWPRRQWPARPGRGPQRRLVRPRRPRRGRLIGGGRQRGGKAEQRRRTSAIAPAIRKVPAASGRRLDEAITEPCGTDPGAEGRGYLLSVRRHGKAGLSSLPPTELADGFGPGSSPTPAGGLRKAVATGDSPQQKLGPRFNAVCIDSAVTVGAPVWRSTSKVTIRLREGHGSSQSSRA